MVFNGKKEEEEKNRPPTLSSHMRRQRLSFVSDDQITSASEARGVTARRHDGTTSSFSRLDISERRKGEHKDDKKDKRIELQGHIRLGIQDWQSSNKSVWETLCHGKQMINLFLLSPRVGYTAASDLLLYQCWGLSHVNHHVLHEHLIKCHLNLFE